jgi:hypothetical protein
MATFTANTPFNRVCRKSNEPGLSGALLGTFYDHGIYVFSQQ